MRAQRNIHSLKQTKSKTLIPHITYKNLYVFQNQNSAGHDKRPTEFYMSCPRIHPFPETEKTMRVFCLRFSGVFQTGFQRAKNMSDIFRIMSDIF